MPKREASGSGTTEKLFDQVYNVVSTDLTNSVKEFVQQNIPISSRLLGLLSVSLGLDVQKRPKLEKEKSYFFHYGEQPPRLVSNYLLREKELSHVAELLEKDCLAALTNDLRNLKLDGQVSSKTQDLEKYASSITGLGGVGKTQLALIYAIYAHNNASLYENTIWIDGENLSNSFRKLAGHPDINIRTKDINGRNKEDTEIVREVYNHFGGKKSLFIFDNVENNEKIEVFLPNKSKELHILITSRWNNWKGIAEELELNVFNEEEAGKFIKKELKIVTPEDIKKLLKLEEEGFSTPIKSHIIKDFIECIKKHTNGTSIKEVTQIEKEFLQKDGEEHCILDEQLVKQLKSLLEHLEDGSSIINDKTVDGLSKKLQGLPLALQQAVAYISQENISVKEYLSKYGESYEEAKKLLNSKAHRKVNNDPYPETVLTTWKVILDKMKNYGYENIGSEKKLIDEKKQRIGNAAIKILNIMAYLGPDNISNAVFEKLSGFKEEEHIEAINLLKNYSMINEGKKSDSSSIHRLVQEVVHIRLMKEEEQQEERDIIKILSSQKKTININSKHNRIDRRIILACVRAAQYNDDDLNEQIKEIIPALKDKKGRYLTRSVTQDLPDQSLAQSILKLVILANQTYLIGDVLINLQKEEKQQVLDRIVKDQNIDVECSMVKILIKHGLEIKLDDVLKLEHDKMEKFLKVMEDCRKFNEKEKSLCLKKVVGEPTGKEDHELFRVLMEKGFLGVDYIQAEFTKLLKGNNIQDASRLIKLVEDSIAQKECLIEQMLKMLNETIRGKKKDIFNHLKKNHPDCVVEILKRAIDNKDEEVLKFLGEEYENFNGHVLKKFKENFDCCIVNTKSYEKELDRVVFILAVPSTREIVLTSLNQECADYTIDIKKLKNKLKEVIEKERANLHKGKDLPDLEPYAKQLSYQFPKLLSSFKGPPTLDYYGAHLENDSLSTIDKEETPMEEGNALLDLESFAQFTDTEIRYAKSSNSPSSKVEVDNVQQSCTSSKHACFRS